MRLKLIPVGTRHENRSSAVLRIGTIYPSSKIAAHCTVDSVYAFVVTDHQLREVDNFP